MVNYQNGKIYKLYSPSKNIIYIGSTTQPLCKRLAEHLGKYKIYNNDNTKVDFTSSFLVLDCEDYKIELIEEYACNNKQQLDKKEGEHIKANECINKNIAGRTKKEWKIDNPDKVKEYNKKHRINNNDKLKEYEQLRNQTDERKAYMKEYSRQYRLKKKAENTI